jgi:predicted GNAT family acetyltransferase
LPEDVTVTDNEDHKRFEAYLDGRLAGVLTYTRTDSVAVYPHTKVSEAYEGRGIGGLLTRTALDDARTRGLKVDPECPFIAAWIAKHPDYKDLVS